MKSLVIFGNLKLKAAFEWKNKYIDVGFYYTDKGKMWFDNNSTK